MPRVCDRLGCHLKPDIEVVLDEEVEHMNQVKQLSPISASSDSIN